MVPKNHMNSLKKREIEMKGLTFKVLLGIIAVNLTIQTVKDVGLFPTAYAQSNDVQKIAICGESGRVCVNTIGNELRVRQ